MSVLPWYLGICLIAADAIVCAPLLAVTQTSAQATVASLKLARELEERGQFPQAEQIYLDQEKHFPKNAEILFHLGTLRMRQKDWSKAIEYLQKCKALQPANYSVLFYLAQAQYFNRETPQAQGTILEAVRVAPNEPAILQKAGEYLCDGGDCARGLGFLLKARTLDPRLENVNLDLGMAYYKLVKHQEAQQILDSVFRNDPNDLVAPLLLGRIAADQGNWDKAREFDDDVLARDPRNADALNDLGTALVALGNNEDALAPLQKALDIDPGLSAAHFQLGKALHNLGRSQEALREMELYRSILDRNHNIQALVSPRNALQNEYWEKCERLLSEDGEAAAIAYVKSLAAEKHLQLNAFYMVGMVYAALQRNQDAVRLLDRAAQVSPDDADIVASLGRIHLRDHDHEQSERDLKRALEMSPKNQIALVGMGELQYVREQWTDAARYFDESRTQEVSALLLMCDAYMRAGNRDKSREAAALVRVFAHGDAQALGRLNSSGCAADGAELQDSLRLQQ